jgi:hypothetical protein
MQNLVPEPVANSLVNSPSVGGAIRHQQHPHLPGIRFRHVGKSKSETFATALKGMG